MQNSVSPSLNESRGNQTISKQERINKLLEDAALGVFTPKKILFV